MPYFYNKYFSLHYLRSRIFFLFLSLAFVNNASYATDRVVCSSGCGYTSIQAAINAASAGDVIIIKAGTYTENVANGILIDKNLTIRGEGRSVTIIQPHAVRLSAVSRVFRVSQGTVIFEELTIQNGKETSTANANGAGSGMLIEGSASVALNNVIVKNNDIVANGSSAAGIGMFSTGTLNINNSRIEGNTNISNSSGGMYLSSGTTSVNNTVFDNNKAPGSGAIGMSASITATFNYCTFSNNEATNSGANPQSGGAATWSSSLPKFYNCTFNNNTAGMYGGALRTGGGWIVNCTFYGNTASNGAAINRGTSASSNALYVINCTVVNNKATGASPVGAGFLSQSTTAPVHLVNTIIANSITGKDLYFADGAGLVTNDKNYVGTAEFAANSKTFTYSSGGNLATTLSNNGGLTQTISVGAGSVLINNGASSHSNTNISIPAKDQRNSIRAGATDIGAYEAEASESLSIAYTALANTTSTVNRTLTATISDNVSGIPTSGSLMPRIHYKKNSGTSWFSTQGVAGANNSWAFTIDNSLMGGVASNDEISYFVVAQDNSAGSYARSLPAGVVTADVNYIGTAPSSVNKYLIGSSLSSPSVTTSAVGQISTASATLGGDVTAENGATLTERGFVYSTTANPEIGGTGVIKVLVTGTSTGAYSQSITGLTAGTTYVVRAYAINSIGTSYGSNQTFTTDVERIWIASGSTTLTTGSINTVNFQANATGVVSPYTISPTGGLPPGMSFSQTTMNLRGTPTSIGQYSLVMTIEGGDGTKYFKTFQFTVQAPPDTQAPTTSGFWPPDDFPLTEHTTTDFSIVFTEKVKLGSGSVTLYNVTDNSNQTVELTSSSVAFATNGTDVTIKGFSLKPGKQYYVNVPATAFLDLADNAYAGVSNNTSWSFSTKAVIATLTSGAASSISSSGATLGGDISENGGANITDRGIVYGTSATPTIGASGSTKVSEGGTTTGTFTKAVTGLSPSTTYYYRAYAINSAGTAYGTAQSFVTLDPAPAISSVNVPVAKTYKTGESLEFAVNYSAAVTISGTPVLPITIGATSKEATYVAAASTSTKLVFRYTIASGDLDADGISLGAAISLPGASAITDGVTTNAILTLNSVGSTAGVLVDAVAPTVLLVNAPSNKTYKIGDQLNFTVNFNENVVVNAAGGTPYVGLTIGTANVNAAYVLGSGMQSLVFRYTVAAGDVDADGVALASSISLNGATLKDAAGNDATLTLNNVAALSSVKVDGIAPTLSTVTITSNNAIPNLAKTGDVVTLSITASEAINTPTVTIAGQTVSVTGSGNTYSASYTMVSSNTEGFIPFTANFSDLSGNAGQAVSASTNSNPTTFDKTAPATPSSFITTSKDSKLELSWSANSENDLKGYRIYWGTSANPTTELINRDISELAYTHTGLANGTTYYYTIVAYDKAGNVSAVSADVAGMPKAGQTITFSPLAAVTYGDGSFGLTASSTSGLTVEFTSDNTSVATVSGTTVTIKGAGSAKISARQSGSSGYSAADDVGQTLIVNKKEVSGSFTADNKVYDGTDAATILTRTVTPLATDNGKLSLTGGNASFADANTGTAKTVTATGMALSGTAAGNYTLAGVSTTTASITAKEVSGSFTADNKVYDGTDAAIILTRTVTPLATDNGKLSLTGGSASFADANAGTSKTVTATGMALSGTAAGNYTLTGVSTTTANIIAKEVSGSFTADNKVYDGTNAATILTRTVTPLATDNGKLSLIGGSASFADANAGTAKTVTATGMALSGAAAGNYTITGVSTTTANIAAKEIAGSFTADNKVYDGTDAATILTRTVTPLATDNGKLSLTGGNASFADANTGTAKTVTATGVALSGAAAGNYTLTGVSTTTASIAAKEIAGSFTADNKVYDGTDAATILTRTVTPLATDNGKLSLTGGSASFADANAGTAKTITATGMALSGTAAGNYTLTGVATTTANITAKEIAGSFTADNKVYDGTDAATILTRTVTPLATDNGKLSLTGGSASFADANSGTAKTVTATGMALSGAAAGNYTLTGVSTTTANITAKEVSGSFTADNKVYDGTDAATILTRTVTPLATDNGKLSLTGGSASFADANAGTSKTVTATGMALSGTAAGNYTLTGVATTAANITAKEISGSFTADNKIYDGTDIATILTRTVTPLATDNGKLSLTGGSASFADANADTTKTVTATGMALSGAAAANYTLTGVATTTANITAKEISGSFTADNKVYDGTDAATILTRTVTPLATDNGKLSLTGGIASFADANAGTAKTVTATGMALSGIAAGNYTLTGVATTTASISAKALTATAQPVTKVYDSNINAVVNFNTFTATDGKVGNDDVAIEYGTATYSDKNVGTAKAITISGLALKGTAKNNYSLNPFSTTGAIVAKALTITAENKEKFQGLALPVFTALYSGFVDGETSAVLTTQPSFSTTANAMSPQGTYPIVVSGATAANYTITHVDGVLTVKPGYPTSISLAATTLYENAPVSSLAGTLSSTSDDPSATFTYTLVSGAGDADNTLFKISGNQLQSNAILNFEGKSSYSVLVRSTTQHGLSLDKQFTISLNNVNEQPTLDNIATQTICYTPARQILALSGISAGEDAGQTTTVSVSSTNNSLFKTLTITQANNGAAQLRYELAEGAAGNAVVNVMVMDNGGTANGGVNMILKSFVLTVNALPVPGIATNKGVTSISKGDVLVLKADGGTQYEWLNANGILSGQNSQNLTIRPDATTTYRVIVTNANGCSESKEITIEVKEDYVMLNGSNLISPNGDGVNDVLKIDNLDMYPNNEVKIFDRAGRLLYSKKNYSKDGEWTATVNGAPLAEDTYYYVVDFGPGKPKYKGFVTIIRN